MSNASDQVAPSLGQSSVTSRLSIMMFLQYAVWGAWLPLLGRYLSGELNFSSGEIGTIIGTAGALGAITAPFIGQLADRVFAAEKALAILMILGGALMFVMAGLTEYNHWMIASVAYSIIYMPTISLSNSLAFAHLNDPDKQFPRVRLWGTIGWIAVSWAFPMLWLQSGLEFRSLPPFLVGVEKANIGSLLADALRLSGVMSLIYGAYCFMLPHTPPNKDGKGIALASALKVILKPGVLALTVIALPISILHTVYFIQTSQFLPTLEGMRTSWVAPAMTVSQFSEIFILFFLGWGLKKLGFRWMLVLGCLCYALRYAAFSKGTPTSFVIASQVLHGFCFACFYATAFMYVERCSPKEVRHSAQTLFGIILLGAGPMLSGKAVNLLIEQSTETHTMAECVEGYNLIPNEPEAGWVTLDPQAEVKMATYIAENPNAEDRAWRSLDPAMSVTALDYSRFWQLAALAGLICAALLAVLFRLDPPGDEEDEERFAE